MVHSGYAMVHVDTAWLFFTAGERGWGLAGMIPDLALAMIIVFQVDRVTVCICSHQSALCIADLGPDTRLLTVCVLSATVGVTRVYF